MFVLQSNLKVCFGVCLGKQILVPEKLKYKNDVTKELVTIWDKYDSYEKTSNRNCPECGVPNACNEHRWLNGKWYADYKEKNLRLQE